MIAKVNTPLKVIGTVNAVEFFVVLVQSLTFVTLIGTGNWQVVSGLIIGGIFTVPLAACLCTKINKKVLMFFVGMLIVFMNTYALWYFF